MPGTTWERMKKEKKERKKRKKKRRTSDGLNTMDEPSVSSVLLALHPKTALTLPTYLQPPPHQNSRFTAPGQQQFPLSGDTKQPCVRVSLRMQATDSLAASLSMRRVENRFFKPNPCQFTQRSVVGPCFSVFH